MSIELLVAVNKLKDQMKALQDALVELATALDTANERIAALEAKRK